jgi:hypothetical protein
MIWNAIYGVPEHKGAILAFLCAMRVLQAGCRWQDCPADYGPSTTVYNRYNRRSQKGICQYLFAELMATHKEISIDRAPTSKHIAALGVKKGASDQAIGRAWVQHQDPRHKQSILPPPGLLPYTRPNCRHHRSCDARRQGL